MWRGQCSRALLQGRLQFLHWSLDGKKKNSVQRGESDGNRCKKENESGNLFCHFFYCPESLIRRNLKKLLLGLLGLVFAVEPLSSRLGRVSRHICIRIFLNPVSSCIFYMYCNKHFKATEVGISQASRTKEATRPLSHEAMAPKFKVTQSDWKWLFVVTRLLSGVIWCHLAPIQVRTNDASDVGTPLIWLNVVEPLHHDLPRRSNFTAISLLKGTPKVCMLHIFSIPHSNTLQLHTQLAGNSHCILCLSQRSAQRGV